MRFLFEKKPSKIENKMFILNYSYLSLCKVTSWESRIIAHEKSLVGLLSLVKKIPEFGIEHENVFFICSMHETVWTYVFARKLNINESHEWMFYTQIETLPAAGK